MKKIYSLLLLAITTLSVNTIYARKDGAKDASATTPAGTNAKEIKPGNAVAPKVAPEANPKTAVPKTPKSGPDSLNAPNSFFYEAKNKRQINIQDVYVSAGGNYIASQGGTNAPFYNGAGLYGSYGTPVLNKYLLLEFSDNADFMFGPDKDWFSKAFSLPKASIKGMNMGFSNEFTIGFHAVIAGGKKLSWTAGVLGGAKMTMLPSMTLNSSVYYVSAPFTFCYGFKSNLYIGNRLYCYAQYANSIARDVTANISAASADASPVTQRVPVNFGVLRIGAAYVLKPWW